MAVLEGIRLVEEGLAVGVPFRGALVSPELSRTSRGAALHERLTAEAVRVETLEGPAFERLADTDTPQGVIAVVQLRAWHLEEVPMADGDAVLALDGVQDPGNVGTMIRTAHALGAAATVALAGTADPFNAKALRGAMGSTFRHPVVLAPHAEFGEWLAARRCDLWIADARGRPLGGAKRPARLAVAFGNEGAGPSAALRRLSAERVAIPLVAQAESLNVAVAAGIFLHEVLRGE